ncbi:nicotinamide-nucleotide adenylyltransferase [Candidatus Micrarchaeota archaeon CG11_big_fil_rev_8_21_14_0_20_47_5]|nr:MAG: nicotinamide-nucleotide adenylyltransferase [Candidatus Micrarchaeota archaeon CG1_02_47_40]PIN83212.1 MAG: nicotinamide-nucleotide adenylyltransferase [Candidatus Micrarchaeota archaeon CG11_big_fil_rev_8_21_14_0_20_47_5]
MTGLFIGRFQPFHLGHLNAIKYALSKCSSLIILVGSAQKSRTRENPFTAKERMEMISRTLKAEGLLSRCKILPITDIECDGNWVSHVVKTAPKFDALYTNNPLAIKLFSSAGFAVKKIPFFSRKSLEATKIRKLMAEGKDWEKLVPKEVAKFIGEINGIGRMMSLEI